MSSSFSLLHGRRAAPIRARRAPPEVHMNPAGRTLNFAPVERRCRSPSGQTPLSLDALEAAARASHCSRFGELRERCEGRSSLAQRHAGHAAGIRSTARMAAR